MPGLYPGSVLRCLQWVKLCQRVANKIAHNFQQTSTNTVKVSARLHENLQTIKNLNVTHREVALGWLQVCTRQALMTQEHQHVHATNKISLTDFDRID